MKTKKIKQLCRNFGAILFAAAIVVTGIETGTLEVSAGSGVNKLSIQEDTTEFDGSMWIVPNDDLTIEDGKVIFAADSSSDTRLLTKEAVQNTGNFDELLKVEATMNFKTVPEGERFILALGVDSVESYCEEAESLEIYIENANGLYVGVRTYNESEEATELVEKVKLGAPLGKDVKVSVKVDSEMKLNVNINNKTICNTVPPVDLTGRVMFTESGECEVSIANLQVESYTYDRPENSNVFEDFENGTLNTEVFDSKMGFGLGLNSNSRMEIVDYNGSNVFMFQKATHCYFGTAQEYSNFELTFDMPYMLFQDVRNEEGVITKQGHKNLLVAIGAPAGANESFVYTYAAETIVFESNGAVYNYITKPTYRVSIDNDVYGDTEKNIGYSVKIRVVDTMITVSLKSRATGQYDEILYYQVGNKTPLGRVYLSTGAGMECAIDNWKITNLDQDGNIIETGYTTFTPPNEDWEYVEYAAPYYTEPQETDTATPVWLYAVGGVAGIGMIFLLVTVGVAIVRKTPRKKKEAETNEV